MFMAKNRINAKLNRINAKLNKIKWERKDWYLKKNQRLWRNA